MSQLLVKPFGEISQPYYCRHQLVREEQGCTSSSGGPSIEPRGSLRTASIPLAPRPTGTTVVTGPLGLLGILQTRLGTTRPTVNRPVRIAQYRSLMAEADHPWYQRSFATDPWNTAHHLLRLRDDVIEAGWQPTTDPRNLR